MGSPISSLVAEHFLLYFEQSRIKHNTEYESVLCHIRYFNDILVIYDHIKVTVTQIRNIANSIHNNLKFSLTQEIDANISFVDLLLRGTTQKLENII